MYLIFSHIYRYHKSLLSKAIIQGFVQKTGTYEEYTPVQENWYNFLIMVFWGDHFPMVDEGVQIVQNIHPCTQTDSTLILSTIM